MVRIDHVHEEKEGAVPAAVMHPRGDGAHDVGLVVALEIGGAEALEALRHVEALADPRVLRDAHRLIARVAQPLGQHGELVGRPHALPAHAVLAREESRGSHLRLDRPQRDAAPARLVHLGPSRLIPVALHSDQLRTPS